MGIFNRKKKVPILYNYNEDLPPYGSAVLDTRAQTLLSTGQFALAPKLFKPPGDPRIEKEILSLSLISIKRLRALDELETPRVILESPFGGPEWERNIEYARACLLDSLKRSEAPFASHLLYTQALDDDNSEERAQGIRSGLIWAAAAEMSVVYMDYGITEGMKQGIKAMESFGKPIKYRKLYEKIDKTLS